MVEWVEKISIYKILAMHPDPVSTIGRGFWTCSIDWGPIDIVIG